MKKEIRCFFQEFWNQLKKTLADKCGELPFGDVKQENKPSEEIIEREVFINDTSIHIRSIGTHGDGSLVSKYISLCDKLVRRCWVCQDKREQKAKEESIILC